MDINHVTHLLEAVADYTNPYMLNGLGMMSNLEMMDTQLFHNASTPTSNLVQQSVVSNASGPAPATQLSDNNQLRILSNLENSNSGGGPTPMGGMV